MSKMPKASATKTDSVLKIAGRIIIGNKGKTILLIFLIAGIVFSSLLPPQLLRMIIDQNLTLGVTTGLGLLAALYLGCFILTGSLDFIKGIMLTKLGQRIICNTREKMFEKLSQIPLRFFTENGVGSITSRFTTDVESINTLFVSGAISMLIDILKIIGILISMALFSIPLSLATLLLIPLIMRITRTFQRKMLKAQKSNLVQLGKVGNHITESISNVQMIKLFSKEIYMEDRYKVRLRENYMTRKKANFYDSVYAPVIQIIRATMIVLVIVAGGLNIPWIGISAGMLAAAVELLSNLLAPVEALGMEFQNIQQGISGIQRVDTFLQLNEEKKDDTLKAENIIGRNRQSAQVTIDFDKVSFGYEPGQEILQEVSFHVEAGESVVLAGRTGVGKTTMMNLILGFLIPNSGNIYVNQVPASMIPDREKRKLFGYVEQKFQFVWGDIYHQITLGAEDISEEQVEQTCKFVGLHEYIKDLPRGYQTQIETETEFSFGQRQLLSIARAIVTDPPVLLLDEMTANLDSETEEKVVKVLDKACENRTIINIAHRAGAIQNQSRIIMLEQGRLG